MSNYNYTQQMNRKKRWVAYRAALSRYYALLAEYANDDTGYLRRLSTEEQGTINAARAEMKLLGAIANGRKKPTAAANRIIDRFCGGATDA
jgi:hypothetical protein